MSVFLKPFLSKISINYRVKKERQEAFNLVKKHRPCNRYKLTLTLFFVGKYKRATTPKKHIFSYLREVSSSFLVLRWD